MKSIKIQNKFWLIFLSIALVVFLAPVLIHAQGAGDSVAGWIGQAIGRTIFFLFFGPFILLLKVEMLILPVVAQYNNFTNQAGVQAGWVAARDLVNMLFIVVLLIMAFGTILKIQNYGYRQMLRKLIIMAILVNFSRTIVGLAIDLFQVVMLTIVSAWKDVAAGNITVALGLDKLVSFADTGGASLSNGEIVGQIIIGYLLGGIMAMIASIVIMAFIVILVVRIVMLWIVIVLSPIAFLANTIPKGEGYFQRWVDMLTKELIVGPMLAFFLWLSFMILQSGNIAGDFTDQALQVDGQDSSQIDTIGVSGVGPTQAGSWNNVLNYIVAIAMLVGSLKVTQTFGSAAGGIGAKFAGSMKSKIGKGYRMTYGRAGAVAGSMAAGGALGLAGKSFQKVGTNLGLKPLTSVGIGLTAVQQKIKADREARRPTTQFAEKFIKDDDQRQKFYEGRPELRGVYNKAEGFIPRGTRYAEYKAKTKNNDLWDDNKSFEDNQAEVDKAIKAAEATGDVEMTKQIKSTYAVAHSGVDGDKSAAGMAKEGIGSFKKINSKTLLDGEGNLTKGGNNIVEQVAKFTEKEQQSFLGSMQEADRENWLKAMSKVNTRSEKIVQPANVPLSANDKERPLIVTNEKTGKEEVNTKSSAFKFAAGNAQALGAVLQVKEFDSSHPDNADKKDLVERRRRIVGEEVGKQTAKNIKDEDLLKLNSDKKEDAIALQALGGYLSATKATNFAENSHDAKAIEIIMNQQQEKNPKNLEVLATNAATRKYMDPIKIGDSWEKQIEKRPADQREMERASLAKNSLQFASEAFKKTTQRDKDDNPISRAFDNDAKQAFVKFINGLNVAQALKINKSDLELDGVFDNLSDSLQNSLLVSGIGDRSRLRNPQTPPVSPTGFSSGPRIVSGSNENFNKAKDEAKRRGERF